MRRRFDTTNCPEPDKDAGKRVKAELLVKATLAKNGLLGVVRDLVLGQTR
jgi:hypothetical protein